MRRTPAIPQDLPPFLTRGGAPPPRTPLIGGRLARPLSDLLSESGASDEDVKSALALSEMAPHLEPLWQDAHQRMIVSSLGYFFAEVISGPDEAPYHGRSLVGRHHIEWDSIVNRHDRFLIEAARDHGKSHFFSLAYPIWRAGWTHPGRLGYVFSATQELSQALLTLVKEELLRNPKLSHLLPIGKDSTWTQKEITLRTGSIIRARGMGTKVRGGHPHWIIVDDCLTDESIYSETIRRRVIDYFLSAITNMVVPGGQIGVVGCVAPETYVATSDGLKRIGSLQPKGQRPKTLAPVNVALETRDGTGVASYFWDNGTCDTIRVRLERGFSLEGSMVHPVWSMDSSGVPAWVKLPDLRVGEYVALRIGANCWGSPVDVAPFVSRDRNEIDLSGDWPYLVGLWTAGGSAEPTGRVGISNTEGSVRRWLLKHPCGMQFEFSSKTSPQTARASAKEFCDFVEWLGGGLSRAPGKVIPERIMSADRKTAIGFLQGLFDGRGRCYRTKSGYQVTLATASPVLAMQAQQLLLNFGILASRRKNKKLAKSERVKNPKHLGWTVRMTGEDAVLYLKQIGFRLTRKQMIRRGRAPGVERGIPCQAELFKEARKEKRRRPKGTGGQPFNISAALDCMRPSIGRVRAAVDWLIESGASGPATRQLSQNLENAERFVWLRVESLSVGRSRTVDFVVPGGHSFVSNGIVSHNTPMHFADLYSHLKETGEYHHRSYPAISGAAGKILFPERYDRQRLEKRKRELKSAARFAREFLCKPLSDEASLFPSALFEGEARVPYCLGMPAAYWDERGMSRFTGVDFAMSTSAGADRTVILTLAVDAHGNRWIANIRVGEGWGFQRQLDEIKEENALMRPDLIHAEANQMQRIFTDEIIRTTDIPIRKFFTAGVTPKHPWRKGMASITLNKHHLERGVPSMRMTMENGKWRIPRGDDRSIRLTDQWMGEFQAMSWQNGQVISVGDHDDFVMATWMADTAARSGGFKFSFGADELGAAAASKPPVAAPGMPVHPQLEAAAASGGNHGAPALLPDAAPGVKPDHLASFPRPQYGSEHGNAAESEQWQPKLGAPTAADLGMGPGGGDYHW